MTHTRPLVILHKRVRCSDYLFYFAVRSKRARFRMAVIGFAISRDQRLKYFTLPVGTFSYVMFRTKVETRCNLMSRVTAYHTHRYTRDESYLSRLACVRFRRSRSHRQNARACVCKRCVPSCVRFVPVQIHILTYGHLLIYVGTRPTAMRNRGYRLDTVGTPAAWLVRRKRLIVRY